MATIVYLFSFLGEMQPFAIDYFMFVLVGG